MRVARLSHQPCGSDPDYVYRRLCSMGAGRRISRPVRDCFLPREARFRLGDPAEKFGSRREVAQVTVTYGPMFQRPFGRVF